MNAIVWQDKRTADICEEMKEADLESYVKEHTGLVIDSYFSATKIAWILRNVEGAREMADRGDLAFGTVDTWLIWKLTKGITLMLQEHYYIILKTLNGIRDCLIF
jgi:glycerol kinase